MARNPNTNASNQNRPPLEPRAPMSKESRFIGYLVLGFGLLAIITVLILAFSGGEETKAKKAQPKQKAPVEAARKLAPELMPTAPAPQKKEAPKQELLFKRDPKMDAAKMNGNWQAVTGEYKAVLQIDKNVFQVVMAHPDPQLPRLYVSGTFKVLEDLVMMDPQKKWPKPTIATQDVNYRMLTSADFPVVVYFDGQDMIWQNPPRSEKRVLVPRGMPLLMSPDEEAILWKKLK